MEGGDERVSLADQRACRDRAYPLEHGNRGAKVIEDAEKQDEIESAQPLDVDVFSRTMQVLHFRVERLVREQKAFLAVSVPREGVDGEHTAGAAPFALEREEAVPGADVEHRLAGE